MWDSVDSSTPTVLEYRYYYPYRYDTDGIKRPHHPSLLRTLLSHPSSDFFCSRGDTSCKYSEPRLLTIQHIIKFFVLILNPWKHYQNIMVTQSRMKRRSRAKLLLLLAAPIDGYITPTPDARSFSKDHSMISNGRVNDRTEIGTLSVPSVGIGTIAWSSDSCK